MVNAYVALSWRFFSYLSVMIINNEMKKMKVIEILEMGDRWLSKILILFGVDIDSLLEESV